MAQDRGLEPGRREASATERGRREAGAVQPGHATSGRSVALLTAVQDAQRKRRKRTNLRRLATIVPVSDYRDVVG